MKRLRRLLGEHGSTLRWVSAGQLDAGFAALSGFVAGIFAVRILEPAALGGYTLLFAAFAVASQVSAQLVFSPAEVIALSTDEFRRSVNLRWSLPIGVPVAVVAAAGVTVGAWPVRAQVDAAALNLLSMTAVAFSAVSPVQDHVRRMLHLSGRSGLAAATSGIQLVTTVAAILILQSIEPLLVPFGAPTAGNVVSATFGVLVSGSIGQRPVARPRTRELVSIGGYLLYIGLSTSGARYIGNTIVAGLAGAATLGFVEAARIIARPADVVATGLYAVVNPRAMASAANRDYTAARNLRKLFLTFLAMIMGTYFILASVPYRWSPLPDIAPTAYDVPWLVGAVIASFFIGNIATPYFAELMGARRQRYLARTEFVAQGIQVIFSFLAGLIGAFAVPLAHAASTGFKAVVLRRASDAYFCRTSDGPAG